ncbi:hypothetical protein M0802_010010 [Mischocyttarus mexicanus]|nr:hypothetical protein M0802_010010 [Mischocyttarus mexicanus]
MKSKWTTTSSSSSSSSSSSQGKDHRHCPSSRVHGVTNFKITKDSFGSVRDVIRSRWRTHWSWLGYTKTTTTTDDGVLRTPLEGRIFFFFRIISGGRERITWQGYASY